MKKLQQLKEQMTLLRWHATAMQIDQMLQEAQQQQLSYLDWLLQITQCVRSNPNMKRPWKED